MIAGAHATKSENNQVELQQTNEQTAGDSGGQRPGGTVHGVAKRVDTT